MGWSNVLRPGYFGKHRDEKHRHYDEVYGSGRWRIAWQFGDTTLTSLPEVCMIYEDAYFCFLKDNREVLRELVETASDVYDDAPSNVESGVDYGVQETNRTHLQDIAIRRCVIRLGQAFRGDRLLQIRDSMGDHPLSLLLSPGRIPFHLPERIVQPELVGWWQPGSVESFYQSNKYLQDWWSPSVLGGYFPGGDYPGGSALE